MSDTIAPASYDPTTDPHLHLMVDNHDIQDQWGLQRIVQQARQGREQPLVVADQPWEGAAVLCWGSVLHSAEDGLWKMWYEGYNRGWGDPYAHSFCYATSADGTTWDKPILDIVDFHGSAANNIVYLPRDFVAAHGAHGLLDITGVIHDPSDPDAARRYKTIFQQANAARTVWGEFAAFSPDGIHWQRRAAPVLADQGDRTNIYHDPITDRYILTTRRHNNMPDGRAGLRRKRVVAWSESDDFIQWSQLRTIIKPDDYDSPDTEFYGMVAFRYGRRYLGFLEIYHTGSEQLDVQLAVSVDGQHWERVARREPLLPTGPVGSWDSVWVSSTDNPPHVVGDQLWLYYQGRSRGHRVDPPDAAIGRTMLGRDRFVALATGHEEGHLVTEPVPVGSERLLVNAACIGGELSVEVIGDDGQVVPGYERSACHSLTEDRIDWPVGWTEHDSLRAFVGQEIRLRFWLRNARLFAYRFAAPDAA